MQEIINRLDSLAKKVSLIECTDINDIKELFDIYDSIINSDATQLGSMSDRIIKTLFHIFECLTDATIDAIHVADDIKIKIIDIINNMAALYTKSISGEMAFVHFLYILNKRKQLYEERDILANCNEYVDRLESLSWLFEIECDGELAYPIGDLLSSSILDNFVPDEDHLLYLIASLQLFGNLRQIPVEAKDTILKYSKQYNLKILELLCDDGKILFGPERKKNMEQNRIIVARKDTTILVRTTDLLHEEIPGYTYEYEINANNQRLAKFTTFYLNPSEQLISLDDFLEKASADECRKVIIKAISDGAYNIFMCDSIIYNSGSRCFVNWVNPMVSQDKVIVSDVMGEAATKGNLEKAFFFTLDRHGPKNWCRPAVLVRNDIDILTIDFLIEFCCSVSEGLQITAASFVPQALENWEKDKSVFAQNHIIRLFFEQVLTQRKNITKAMTAYTQFVIKNYDSSGDIDENTRLVMPYAFYMPFQSYEDVLLTFLGVQNANKETYQYVEIEHKVDGQWLKGDTLVDLPILDIKTQDLVIPSHMTAVKYKGLYDTEANKIYVLTSTLDKPAINAIDTLIPILNRSVIYQENISCIRTLPIDSLYEIIHNIGISNKITSFFWPKPAVSHLSVEQQVPLLLYKILHHICFYEIQNKLDKWKKLIFDCHLIDTCKRDAAMYTAFADETHKLAPGNNCLLISKQQHADKSTLEAILEFPRERSIVDIAFDAQALNSHIELIDNRYCFKTKDGTPYEIKRIIFLTDNIISGASTKIMLKFHLSGQSDNDEAVKRSYIVLEDGKTIRNIIDINSPRIEIHTAFWFSSIGDCPRVETDDPMPCFEISVADKKKFTVYVNAQQTYLPTDYSYTQQAFDLAKDLYARKSAETYSPSGRLAHRGDTETRHLLFRFNNMPSFYLFPEDVMDTQKKIGLFDHRKENV